MFKKSIKKIINILGFDIRRRNLGEKNLSFDEILKKNLGNEPMILDVGANRGQSIKRFFNLFISSSSTALALKYIPVLLIVIDGRSNRK